MPIFFHHLFLISPIMLIFPFFIVTSNLIVMQCFPLFKLLARLTPAKYYAVPIRIIEFLSLAILRSELELYYERACKREVTVQYGGGVVMLN